MFTRKAQYAPEPSKVSNVLGQCNVLQNWVLYVKILINCSLKERSYALSPWGVFGTQKHIMLILKDTRALLWRGNTSYLCSVHIVFNLEGKFTQRISACFLTILPNPMKDPCLQLQF